MPILDQLRWITPPSPVMAHLRVLTDPDSVQHYVLMDFMAPPPPDEFKSTPNMWLAGHVTHGVVGPSGPKQSRLPALGLTDGKGRFAARLAFIHPEQWALFRGMTLPPFNEQGRMIEFPPAP